MATHQLATSFPDTSYSTTNKPSSTTLKSDIQILEDGHNAHDSDTDIHVSDLSAVVTLTGSQTLTNKTLTAPVVASFYQDAAKTKLMTTPSTASDTLAAIAATQTLTNKTLTSPVINTGISGTAIVDEDNMVSDSATKVPTQQSVKAYADAISGTVIQVVNVLNITKTTGTTVIPADDTIPQITEGDEYMTLAITPTSATSKLLIQIVLSCACSSATNVTAALFQDATAGALNAMSFYQTTSNGGGCYTLNHYMTAGTTSATTFRVRAGGGAGTLTVNGNSGNRILGGVLTSSITITELTA